MWADRYAGQGKTSEFTYTRSIGHRYTKERRSASQSQVKNSPRLDASTQQSVPQDPPAVDMAELPAISGTHTRTVVGSPPPTSPWNQLLNPNILNEDVQLLGQNVRFTFSLQQKISYPVVNCKQSFQSLKWYTTTASVKRHFTWHHRYRIVGQNTGVAFAETGFMASPLRNLS
ncbi:hypothetical protein TNIN_34021 [Trichonephila inaurata madagascariensis]|uniref:Uncharacterized protein n=1 Tax=Trichonephila inaurata madagascariensis TaxID=2747483 RepID=A0A8X6ICS4_9ARAC|nr:hypothetical protein TNIN_34021 [Trichonephila inaurata madagascariensis]